LAGETFDGKDLF